MKGLTHVDNHEGRPSSLQRWPWRELLFLTLGNHLPRLWLLDRYRHVLYRWAGVSMVGRATIQGPLTVRPYGACRRIRLGKGCFLNTETRFACNYDGVSLGDNVQVGPRVSFETMGHGLDYVPGQGRGRTSAPIVVGDEVWIGAGAIILGGVTIGRGSVVAAGAVVHRDVPPYTLVGGLPAKVIRQLKDPTTA